MKFALYSWNSWPDIAVETAIGIVFLSMFIYRISETVDLRDRLVALASYASLSLAIAQVGIFTHTNLPTIGATIVYTFWLVAMTVFCIIYSYKLWRSHSFHTVDV